MVTAKDDPDDYIQQFQKALRAGHKQVKSPRQAKLALMIASPACVLVQYAQMIREIAAEFGCEPSKVTACCTAVAAHLVNGATAVFEAGTSAADSCDALQKQVVGIYKIVDEHLPDPPAGKDDATDGEEEEKASEDGA